ncbi:MAG: zinc-binding dehydrogenase [Bacteroidales bacterium]|nr:zinc-binding dehydrogenase [Bacteroidales bacterium]
MKAYYLVKNGNSNNAFELRDINLPEPKADEVSIEVEAFGLNFADVMARLGYYKACPPLPTVIGYDVAGKVIKKGANVKDIEIGQRVTALTRFGGYATHVNTNQSGVVPIKDNTDATVATALATQYSTAYYAAEFSMNLQKGEHVLIQAAAGGVGTALTQLAKRKGCIVYGTAGSEEKLKYIKNNGVDFPINYRKQDFYEYIKAQKGEKSMDAIFDSIGGNYVKKGLKLLAPGGRLAMYGAAQIAGDSDKKSLYRQLKTLFGFGKYSPTQFFGNSQAMIGVNKLQIGDFKPYILKKCMSDVVDLYNSGEIKPFIGKVYDAKDLAEAHNFLQKRKSVGKVVCKW